MKQHGQKTLSSDLIETISEARILKHLEVLEGEKEARHTPDALRKAGDYLSNQMRTFGLHPVHMPISPGGVVTTDADGEACFNVIGRLKEATLDQERLVIGAHYDTVVGSPGADDNASSLAVLLETARVLTPLCQTLRGGWVPEFAAFSLEEPGFIGSADYLVKAEAAGLRIWGAVILECVGYTDHTPGSQLTPPGLPFPLPDKGHFIGLLGNEPAKAIKEAFESAARRHTPSLPCICFLVPGNGALLPDARRSDHVPFWDKGYPAVMLTDTADFRNPHYHRASDRRETLDISFITQVAKALSAAVVQMLELETKNGH